MAKRGRKKKSKITQLSAADKGHLKRILGKVRQIKSNKAAQPAPAGDSFKGSNSALQLAYSNAQRDYSNLVSLSKTTNVSAQLNAKFELLTSLRASAAARKFALKSIF